MPTLVRQQLTRHQGRIELVVRYLTGQGILQVLNVLNGFFLLRWLSIEEQAKYTFAFSLQSGMSVLADLGFSGCIVALVGEAISDKKHVGEYIAVARFFRHRFLFISFVIGAIAIPFLTARQAWPWSTQTLLLIPVLVTIYLQGAISFYTAPLQMHRQLTALYSTQVALALLRLILCSVLYLTGVLTVYGVLWVYNLTLFLNGLAFRQKSAPFLLHTDQINPTARRAMLTYLKPLIPSLLFNAFYGQISIYIMTYFGDQRTIAVLGALARLSQLFLLLNTFNGMVLVPYIARQSDQQLPRAYTLAVVGAILIAGLLNVLVWQYPAPFLWLIGDHYRGLERELTIHIANQSLLYVAAVMWSMHAARKWIFGFNAWIYIVGLTLIQWYIVRTYNLTTVYTVLATSLIPTCFILLLHIETGIIGWYTVKKCQPVSV